MAWPAPRTEPATGQASPWRDHHDSRRRGQWVRRPECRRGRPARRRAGRLDPPPAPATAFPFGGPLADLTPCVERTVPDPAAAPVFRGYDLSCTFRTGTVPQLYGGDLALRLSGDDGIGLDLGVDWQQAATTTASEADSAWLARLLDCAGRPSGGLGGDDVLVASLPAGTVLPANRMLTARLLATRPLFTDPFDDLAGFDQQVLGTGAAVTSCSAAGGVATIARPRNRPDSVVALAGDPEMAGLHRDLCRDAARRRQFRPGRRARRPRPPAGAGGDRRRRPEAGRGEPGRPAHRRAGAVAGTAGTCAAAPPTHCP